MIALEPGGRTYSQIGKVTGKNEVLGFSYNPGGDGHAMIWTPSSVSAGTLTLAGVTPR